MIEFCVEVDGKDTWFPVLERKRAKAQPETHHSEFDAKMAARNLQAIQPYVRYRVAPFTPVVSSH